MFTFRGNTVTLTRAGSAVDDRITQHDRITQYTIYIGAYAVETALKLFIRQKVHMLGQYSFRRGSDVKSMYCIDFKS